MYLLPDMVDMGLGDGQKWPTKAHRVVAQNLLLGNPLIRCRDQLNEGVQKVIAIPASRIETLTVADLPARPGSCCLYLGNPVEV